MNNTEELLNTIYLEKRGVSSIMDEQEVTTTDIFDVFNNLTQNIKDLGVSSFNLADYNVVYGDYVTGVQYTKDDRTYYMMIGANSRFAPPHQIAVGAIDNDKVYMMSEDFPSTTSIGLVAFPKFAVNQRTLGFVSKSYRDTIHLFRTRSTLISDEGIKCLECGFEAIDAFCLLVKEVKNQDKRKKLSL